MKYLTTTMAAAALSVAAAGLAQAATVDVVDSPTGFFVPDNTQVFNFPYYRNAVQDWGWTHNAIGGLITTAELLIDAFDVDFSSGERDAIYVEDNGTPTFIGYLAGGNDIWAFTTFTLGANFFDDIASGLKVFMDIDSTNSGWLVTLAKSVVTVDGAKPPPPGFVPLPAAGWLMIAGIGGLAALRRRKQA